MRVEQFIEILNNKRLEDIPLLDVIRVLAVVLESEYDYKRRSKKCRSSDTDKVLIVIQ